jgi:hypothetical protein
MKKYLILIFAIALFSNSSFFAQDTLLVPDQINGEYFGALNKTILGDTTADGNRKHKVYKLERGKIYLLNGTLKAAKNADDHIIIVADKPDDDNPPPIITAGFRDDGSNATGGSYIHSGPGDLTIKNVYFNTYPPKEAGSDMLSWTPQAWAIIQLAGENRTFEFDGCYFEGTNWTTMIHWTPPRKVTVKNCYFRNMGKASVRWNGVGLNLGNNDVDTVIMRNNTFFNMQSFALQGQYCHGGYVEFTHNTYVNSIQWPITWLWQTNAVFSNNLFYNANCLGASQSEKNLQEEDSLDWGVINLGKLPPLFTDTLGIAESDRRVDINNNNWFFSQTIQDYWNSIDTVDGEPFLNSRVQNYMDDDTNWPLMNEANNLNLDPGFTQVGDGEVEMARWMSEWWAAHTDSNLTAPNFLYHWDPDNDRFAVQWPLPEVLTYSNSTLLTASEEGLPVGDLYHWYPNEYQQWVTGIEEVNTSTIPGNFVLEQNYPNPFNPETIINYSISKTTDVNITVFNALGQKVQTLVNQKQNTGNYKVNWNGKDNSGKIVSSGVYFYTLKAGNFTSTRKMILLR